jgi:hypothetical protein
MSDVELAVRFLAFKDDDHVYRGDLKAYLDGICDRYNTKFVSVDGFATEIQNKLDKMDSGIRLGIEAFGENKFCRKYGRGAYETRFNRALFDIFSYTLS